MTWGFFLHEEDGVLTSSRARSFGLEDSGEQVNIAENMGAVTVIHWSVSVEALVPCRIGPHEGLRRLPSQPVTGVGEGTR